MHARSMIELHAKLLPSLTDWTAHEVGHLRDLEATSAILVAQEAGPFGL